MLYEYGYFNNQTLLLREFDAGRNQYERLDRNYQGGGLALNLGSIKDYDHIQLRMFVGLEYTFRFYEDIIHEKYEGQPAPDPPTTATRTYYRKNHIGFRLGVEIGLKM